jgi:putative DNA primase/helicase
MTPIDLVLDRLQYTGARTGSSFKCHCPAHDDRTESLSVTEKQDGTVMFKCHAGCDQDKVLAAMGLTWPDLFPNGSAPSSNGASPPKKSTSGKKNLGTPVAIYDYVDLAGNVLHQTLRYEPKGEPKTFRQRRPDGKGGWIWKLDGVMTVLYRLRELVATPIDQWVFVVEGEKDADRLASLGLTATCNAMGGGKWKPDYNVWLTGRRVCIIADNDDTGRNHARDVASQLLGIAAEVKVLELPGLPDKGDVSDWLNAGGTADELIAMVEAAAPYVSTPTATPLSTGRISRRIEADYIRWGYTFAEDERDGSIYVNGERMDDALEATIKMRGRDEGYGGKGLPLAALSEMCLVLARRNRFHPVRDWLNSLVWDGQPHLQRLATYFKDKHPPIIEGGVRTSVFTTWIKRFMQGAIAKAMGNLDAQPPVPVLSGDQNIGKSYFPRWLASGIDPAFGIYSESPLNVEDPETERYQSLVWIWEISELGSTLRRADRDALKSFLTRTTAKFRVPYAKHPVTKPTLACFVATINNEVGFLTDPTGARRFLPVELESIDRRYSQDLDVSQLWAEAMHYYRQGATWKLTPAEEAVRDALADNAYVTSDTREGILKYFEIDPGNTNLWAYTIDIKQTLETNGIKTNVTAIGAELRKLTGSTSIERSINGRRGKGFYGVRLLP